MNNWDSLVGIILFNKRKSKQEVYVGDLKIELDRMANNMFCSKNITEQDSTTDIDVPIENAVEIVDMLLGLLIQHYPDKTPGQLTEEIYLKLKTKL